MFTTTASPCEQQDCSGSYVWLQEECRCVCPPHYCPKGTVHGNDCDCIPATTEGPCVQPDDKFCPRSWFWNPEICDCALGCDFIRQCQTGFKWDLFKCDCFDACPSVQCEKHFAPDAENNCECIPSEPICDFVLECPYWQTWDSNVCGCTGEPCEPCGLGCFGRENPDDCSSQCLCDGNYCEQIMECPFGQQWDFINCGCIGDIIVTCPPTECMENQILNPETCNCDCGITEADCSGPLTDFDPYSCICKRYPCDPPWPCPEGEIIDWSICNCAPDPNYSSTTKQGHGSHSHSKEHLKSKSNSKSKSCENHRSKSSEKKKNLHKNNSEHDKSNEKKDKKG